MKISRNFYIVIILFVLLPQLSVSQNVKTKVRGKVVDKQTKEPLPFVNIVFTGTSVGCITDFQGEYYIETRTPGDSLMASFLGYKSRSFPVKKNQFQTIDFELEPSDITLNEIVVYAGENPAHPILRDIIKNKKRNDPSRFNSYEYEVYNKIEFDVNNVDEDFKQKRAFKHFQFIFDYMDTSVVTGKSYLPVFITETLSDYYFHSKPSKTKEVIKASNISGVENESILQFTGQMYLDVNVYDNFIGAFGKSFVSPIADFGLLTYKYFLVDSAFIDNNWCYLISFKPKRKQELTFTGEFWVHDTTFAIKKIKARIADDANINYVNDLVVTQEFSFIQDSVWFLTRDETFVDFNIGDKSTGFFGRKLTSKKNVIVGEDKSSDFFLNTTPQETILLDNASNKDTAFWNNARHEKLSTKEEKIYAMVDSVKNVPLFNTFVDVVNLFINGYYVTGPIELGPYYKTFSFNPIEGSRFRLGGRTSNDFSTKIMYDGYLAYGTKDQVIKYQLGFLYMFSKTPRVSARLSYKYDIEQLGQSINAFTESNILASLLARNPRDKLLMVRELNGYYEKEWFHGFSNTLHFSHKQIFPSDNIPFEYEQLQKEYSDITAFEITLSTRLAWNEKFVQGEFERISMGSEYPIVKIDLTKGFKNMVGSDYDYFKIHTRIQHDFNINPFGKMNIILEGGKIWGDLPYPLLRLHEGNETYAFDEYSYNMMNYYEFVSDEYAGAYVEHHFQGLFLNKVPLFRRLKWREVIYGKALIGNLDDEKTLNIMDFPETLSELSKPYFEAGVGIENILKIFRIDALWRLSYLDNPNIEVFSVRAKIQIIF